MERIINYIVNNSSFFILIGVMIIVYYSIYFLVFGTKRKKQTNKNFNIEPSINKNFNIFEKNKTVVIDDEPYPSNSENEDWLKALNELEQQSLDLENDTQIEDILKNQGISSARPDKDDYD